MLIETIGFQATAAAAAGSAATAFSGDSLTVKNGSPGKLIALMDFFGRNQTVGFQQITAPSFNDTTRGIRSGTPAAVTASYIQQGCYQPLQAQETIAATIAATAVAGDIEQGFLTILYEDLPGQSGRYISEEELNSKSIRMVTVYATIATGTSGGWSGAELITAESDLLRANTDYALLGITVANSVGAVGVRAPDWANARIAVPANANDIDRQSWYFMRMTQQSGFPCIPVFNSANKNNIFIDAAADENGADPVATLVLVELAM